MNGLILNCEENCPIEFSGAVLKMCGGYRVNNLAVTEVRQVLLQMMKRKLSETQKT